MKMSKLEKIAISFLGLVLISMCSFGIILVLTRHYIEQTLNGQELWLCMLLAAGLTFICDLEEEMKKKQVKAQP